MQDHRDELRKRKYIWCRDLTIKVLEGNDYKEIPAAQYMCEADHSDMIVYFPLGQRDDLPLRRSNFNFEELPQVHVLTGAIDQPLDADADDDPSTARVYSLIRASHSPDYITYKCAHGTLLGQGHGIHLAKSEADIKACRTALGVLSMKWP